jgi:hypothetical protein
LTPSWSERGRDQERGVEGRPWDCVTPIVNIVDPDVIVFGGRVSNITSILGEARAKLDVWGFSDSGRTAGAIRVVCVEPRVLPLHA